MVIDIIKKNTFDNSDSARDCKNSAKNSGTFLRGGKFSLLETGLAVESVHCGDKVSTTVFGISCRFTFVKNLFVFTLISFGICLKVFAPLSKKTCRVLNQ